MPKRKRRDQHHTRQEAPRRKAYQVGGTTGEVYKVGFPMSLFGNVKLFGFIGLAVVAIFIVTAIFTTQLGSNGPTQDIPSPTPTATIDPSASPTASASASASPAGTPTPNAKNFTAAEPVVDAAKFTYKATVKTSKGDFVIDLDAVNAPNTVNSFVFLAQKGFFDGITFHRIVTNFVIQTGDPTGSGSGGPGYKTNEEPSQISNKRGTISMAKSGGAKDFGSQWFVNLKDNPSLDFTNAADKFYPFGTVTQGLDVIDNIGKAGSAQGRPVETVTITGITITSTPK